MHLLNTFRLVSCDTVFDDICRGNAYRDVADAGRWPVVCPLPFSFSVHNPFPYLSGSSSPSPREQTPRPYHSFPPIFCIFLSFILSRELAHNWPSSPSKFGLLLSFFFPPLVSFCFYLSYCPLLLHLPGFSEILQFCDTFNIETHKINILSIAHRLES